MPSGEPFTEGQRREIERVRLTATRETGLTFAVYVGPLAQPTREAAGRLHAELPAPDGAVLVAVSPEQRRVEVVTGPAAVDRLPDRACALAALSMSAAFAGGDLAGGLTTGLRMLAESAGRVRGATR